VYGPFIPISLINNLATSGLMSSNIRFMILINYATELVAPCGSVVFRKSPSSVKNTVRSLFLG
jgi:hypothetical protein